MCIKTKLEKDMIALFKEHSQREHTYINPNFLSEIEILLYDYFKIEDDDVHEWIQGMWGA